LVYYRKSVTPLRLIVTNNDSPSAVRGIAVRSAFTRHVAERRTVHSGTVQDRRVSPESGGVAVPLEMQEDAAVIGRNNRMSFFNKLTSKFTKRWVYCFEV